MSSDLVKSAARALEILEVFADRRERMTAAQLGGVLGYPKSSLSGLLKSLVAQGYLSNGEADGEYFPTLKLSRLGEWIPEALLGSEALLPLLAALRDQTGETVTITVAAGLHMRCLHAVVGSHPISLRVEEGVTFPMIGTAIGTMYLATQPEATAKRLFDRWLTQTPGRNRGKWAELQDRMADARLNGFVSAYDVVVPDTGAIAMPLQLGSEGETMILAVAGLNHRIHQEETSIVKAMRATLLSAVR